jgi:tryptophan-rich sensory protein
LPLSEGLHNQLCNKSKNNDRVERFSKKKRGTYAALSLARLFKYLTLNHQHTQDIKKPSWRPPNFVFPIVWTFLYLSMGYASYLVWRDGGETLNGPAGLPLTLFAITLFLNYAWSYIFFFYHNLKWV